MQFEIDHPARFIVRTLVTVKNVSLALLVFRSLHSSRTILPPFTVFCAADYLLKINTRKWTESGPKTFKISFYF